MNTIEIVTIPSSKQTLVYNLTSDKTYTKIPSTKQEDFYHFLKCHVLKVDYVMMGFNQPYRNTLYALYPHIKICINRQEVEKLFFHTVGVDFLFYEEVAVTTESNLDDIYLVSQNFIKSFYQQTNRVAAGGLYKEWASQMPMGIPYLYRLIRVMEFYMEEILNYFEIKDKFY